MASNPKAAFSQSPREAWSRPNPPSKGPTKLVLRRKRRYWLPNHNPHSETTGSHAHYAHTLDMSASNLHGYITARPPAHAHTQTHTFIILDDVSEWRETCQCSDDAPFATWASIRRISILSRYHSRAGAQYVNRNSVPNILYHFRTPLSVTVSERKEVTLGLEKDWDSVGAQIGMGKSCCQALKRAMRKRGVWGG